MIPVRTWCHFDRLCPELSGRSVNGICTLVLLANILRGRIRKVSSPFPTLLFLVVFFFCCCFFGLEVFWGLLDFLSKWIFLVVGRRTAMGKLIYFFSKQIMMETRQLQHYRRNQFKCLSSYLYKTGTTHSVKNTHKSVILVLLLNATVNYRTLYVLHWYLCILIL